MPLYTGANTAEISFPLGGLGSGCIGLGGNGRLKDWEIFNRPSKNSVNAFTHFMVRAEQDGQVIDKRVLQGDWQGSAIGGETSNIYRGNGGFGYGVGPFRGTMAGVPHFEEHSFLGEFPYATITFRDEHFPGDVVLRAFNPFIPSNEADSSLPAAFFEVSFQNPSPSETIEYTVLLTLNNMQPYGTTVNRLRRDGKITSLFMDSNALDENDPLFGNLCAATDAEETSWQEYWTRSLWFDSLVNFWDDVSAGGKLKNRNYAHSTGGKRPFRHDGEEPGTVAAHCKLLPGESQSIRFVVSWFYPNCTNSWSPSSHEGPPDTWKHYYSTLFSDSHECCIYALSNWNRLDSETQLFKNALFSTSLPGAAIDAISANLSTLKSATCLRLTNGEFYGFEGCGGEVGCCEGSCSHVWNYAYALPYLFPKLQRSMRDLDYEYNQGPDGGMSFRLMLPLGKDRAGFRPCVDGQMGGVIQVWRDFLISGDIDWLALKWPQVQKAIEFAWADTNIDGWDLDRDGVMEGRQHHTLDMELFGPSSWLNGFYLGALNAGMKIAKTLGDSQKSQLYSDLFSRGRDWCNEHLFNGEYFIQKIDLKDKGLVEKYEKDKPLEGSSTSDAYWDTNHEEIRYQIANGCAADQVVAQWHAKLSGLDCIFEEQKVKAALSAIYQHNFKKTARNSFNPARVFCLDGESGLRICSWPAEAKQPRIPITYAQEVFCGIEYQVAAHMLQVGMSAEAFEIIRGVRERHNGRVRNPWNEFECGSNYVRSMSSFSILPSVSGFSCNLAEGYVGFDPTYLMPAQEFVSFFAVDGAWGIYAQNSKNISLNVLYGSLALSSFGMPSNRIANRVELEGEEYEFRQVRGRVLLETDCAVSAGNTLIISCQTPEE